MNEKICRLCLQTISKNNSQAIAESLVKTLKLNLKISKESVMCVECAHFLQVFSRFAPSGVDLGDGTLPLSDLQNDVKLEATSNVMGTKIKCSFCTEIHGREDLILLNESTKNLFLMNMLEQYILETNVKNTEELLTCGTCLDELQCISSFILNCLEVEEKISGYIELEGTNDKGQIELKEVQQFMFKPILKLDVESVGVNKLEEKFDQIQEDTTMAEDEIKYKKEISHPELIIKTEYADIKSEQTDSDIAEQNDCDGFQESFIDNNVPYDPLHKLVVTSEMRKCKEKVFCCEICLYKTKHEGYWGRHLLNHKRPLLKCELCSYEEKYKSILKLHSLSHRSSSDINMFKCELCSYQAKQQSTLKKHLLTHKSPSELKMFKCELYSYEAKRKSNLRQHLLIHKNASEIKMFKCELCPYEAKQKSQIRTHVLAHMNPSKIKMFRCKLCSYKAKRKHHLEQHLLTHKSPSKIKVFECKTCSFETKYKTNLAKHLLTHKSQPELKMFKCEMCSFETKYKYNHDRHLLTHKKTKRKSHL